MKHFEPRTSRRDNRVRHVYHPARSGRMVKLEIHHRDGGMNHFSGRTEKRGIEISISTVDVSDAGNGVMMETSSPMDDCNLRILLQETARYSAGKVAAIAATLDPIAPEISTTWATDRNAAIAMIQQACGIERLAA